jgi:hypothetical protein
MNIRQLAAMNVAKFVAVTFVMGAVSALLLNIWGVVGLGLAFTGVMLVYAVKSMYDIELSKLESKNALAKLKELE